MKQSVYLVPLPIVEGALHTLSPDVTKYTAGLTHYFAEDLRTGRRFIKSLHTSLVMETIQFAEIDKHNGPDKQLFEQWLNAGHSVGIMSDAGCPGIADPGAELVAIAHRLGIQVVPLTGPSSILLALMASGLNGQSFAFTGYLPVKEPQRSKRIKELEAHSAKENQTQAFIETPYRNNHLLADLLKNCSPRTRICIALNITAENQYIKTQTAADWKKNIPTLEKQPAIFLILA
jgi:16S rRNA (cytidine1402-2'-O)-methyltransferase